MFKQYLKYGLKVDVTLYSSKPGVEPQIIKVDKIYWKYPQYIDINDPRLTSYCFVYSLNRYKRSPEIEHILKDDPDWSYLYAKVIIKGRWPEAEEAIKRSKKWLNYCAEFIPDNLILKERKNDY